MPEFAEDARFNVPYTGPYGEKREGGPMDRNYEPPATDAWGKVLPDGYATVSPGVVQKEFEVVLKDGEQLNQVVYDLFVRAERKIPNAAPLFWRQSGNINGHPVVLVQGPPGRLAYFEELYNKAQEPTPNGWIHWISEDGESSDTFQRVLWLLWDGDRSKLTTQAGEQVRCHRAGCEKVDSPRWAVAYNVECLGAHVPMVGYEVEMLCQTCATPDCDTAVFIAEEK